MATRYKDRITILEDAEIEELYGRPRFTHDERVHYFALTPEERAVADGHYSLASRVLFILQAGYFKAKTLFFSFGQLHHLLQCLHPIGIARARRAPAGLPTDRRDQASEPGKLEARKPLRGLQLPGYRRWGRPPGIGQSLGGSPR
jgi:Domain of unknown function (DUF4158)